MKTTRVPSGSWLEVLLFTQSKRATCRNSSRSVEMPTSFPWIISYCGSLPRPRRAWPANEPEQSWARISHASIRRSLLCQCRKIKGEEEDFRLSFPQNPRWFLRSCSCTTVRRVLKKVKLVDNLFFPLHPLFLSLMRQREGNTIHGSTAVVMCSSYVLQDIALTWCCRLFLPLLSFLRDVNNHRKPLKRRTTDVTSTTVGFFIFIFSLPGTMHLQLETLYVSWKGKISHTADVHHVCLSLLISSI